MSAWAITKYKNKNTNVQAPPGTSTSKYITVVAKANIIAINLSTAKSSHEAHSNS